MKQVLQSPRTGEIVLADVPAPAAAPGFVTVRTSASLISAGTERTIQEFGKKSLLGKAIARPDLVSHVLQKARRDGIVSTLDTVRTRLEEPTSLGYSSAGIVIAVAEGISDLAPGARVACAGAGFATHAEVVSVPRNLCALVPEPVTLEEAAFSTIGAIALHGVRLAEVELGQRVAVIGLGVVGLLAVQLARAAGARVAALDLVPERMELARTLGAELVSLPDATAVRSWSGHGVDAVLITADSQSNAPVELAGTIARDRAVVVAVGAVGMTIPRRIYYAKELKFLISRSYGPGRYDPSYEIEGRDYPIGYIRWTEGRNLSVFLDLMASGQVQVAPLITERFAIGDALQAYGALNPAEGPRPLGVLLTYPGTTDVSAVVRVATERPVPAAPAAPMVGLIGAGSFATATLLPALRSADARLIGIASRRGVTAAFAAKRFGFEYCASDAGDIIRDDRINTVFIATRHGQHAEQVLAARAAGKHVFAEKPLCITLDELRRIEDAYRSPDSPLLMVGFNRRFAPLAQSLRSFVHSMSPPTFVDYRVNAGYVPPEHWIHDPKEGGGRVIGEACHFIDFVGWLIGQAPLSVTADRLPDVQRYRGDNVVIRLRYPNGSIGAVTYVAFGNPGLGKERIEASGAGRSAILQDFRVLKTYVGSKQTTKRSLLRTDKGHVRQIAAFLSAVEHGRLSPIPSPEIFTSTRATFKAVESADSNATVLID